MYSTGTRGSLKSANIPGPDPVRWNAPVSNLFGPGDDNPSESIVEYTFDVVLEAVAVQSVGKIGCDMGESQISKISPSVMRGVQAPHT